MLGFIIIRHVTNKMTDLYWKECYKCIRTFYNNPIIIIDDSSNEFLDENIVLTNCTTIYDKEHKGAGEILPYYYFHKLKPFDTAVIIHDSVFIQRKIDFGDNVAFLWSFDNRWNHDIFEIIIELFKSLDNNQELIERYHDCPDWKGCFGGMSVMNWEFLNTLHEKYNFFNMLPNITNRPRREAFERILGTMIPCGSVFGDIYSYCKWGITYTDYLLNNHPYPVVKVWTGR